MNFQARTWKISMHLTTLAVCGVMLFISPACTQDGDHISDSLGYYERTTGGNMKNVMDASVKAMDEMDMTITSKDISPQVTTIKGHTNPDNKPIHLTLTWLNVESIRIGLRIGDGMIEGGDPRAPELIRKIVSIRHPRSIPRESVDYPHDMPERLRF